MKAKINSNRGVIKFSPRALWGVVIVLVIIGIAAVVRRALYLTALVEPFINPEFGAFDAGFAQYSVLTWLHIIPGFLFMVLGPLQFVRQIRSRNIQLHRWSGRVFVAAGVVIGVTALIMSFLMSIGGANETAATTFFAIIFLFALGKAFLHIRRREIIQHREWMIRAFAIGLAIATVRPIVGMFFGLTDLSPQEFFGIAFWLGFTSHLIIAEVWINYTRPKVKEAKLKLSIDEML
jgi:uncharacterized membrane protein